VITLLISPFSVKPSPAGTSSVAPWWRAATFSPLIASLSQRAIPGEAQRTATHPTAPPSAASPLTSLMPRAISATTVW